MFAIHHGDMGEQKPFLHPAHLPGSIWSSRNCFDSEPPAAYGEKTAPEVKLKVEAGPGPRRTRVSCQAAGREPAYVSLFHSS